MERVKTKGLDGIYDTLKEHKGAEDKIYYLRSLPIGLKIKFRKEIKKIITGLKPELEKKYVSYAKEGNSQLMKDLYRLTGIGPSDNAVQLNYTTNMKAGHFYELKDETKIFKIKPTQGSVKEAYETLAKEENCGGLYRGMLTTDVPLPENLRERVANLFEKDERIKAQAENIRNLGKLQRRRIKKPFSLKI